MSKNWKFLRSRLQICSLLFILVILSFDSCFSLKHEGLESLEFKEDAADLRVIGFHRKLLGRFFNPYVNLTSYNNRPVAIIAPSSSVVPSPGSKAQKSSTSPPPQKGSPAVDVSAPPPFVPFANFPRPRNSKISSNGTVPILAGCIGGAVFLLLLATGVVFFRSKAGKSVNPWRTGLSGQLQKVFITGVPKLKRSEIEAACEDFSNVIGSCPFGTLFKGTLSTGVEIAVASVATVSAKEWTNNIEMQFRKKIEMLSKINHKNFVNLLGYCEEDEPFTRILVFEYASNGSVFEHLHYNESEHLDWVMRLRIAMGIAYCLDHMHGLKPPIVHSNLLSSSVHLTEDYAVKIADFSFSNIQGPSEKDTSTNALIDSHFSVTTQEDNVRSFGLLLFELMTGKLPESVTKRDSIDTGLADFLRGKTLREMADPTLECFDEKIENIGEVIKCCVKAETKERPTMKEVAGRLREITGLSPDDAIPKLSPLWWAELEMKSTA